MNQVWNILKKDIRRFWLEGAASLALLGAYAWNDVRGWKYGDEVAFSTGVFSYRFLSGLVDVLVPLAWAFIIVRVIQDESLVGDRQFWLTRPYEWKKLLPAKLLFFLAFINGPLLLTDIVLLSKAGFSPTGHVLGLLWMQLMIALFLMLPTVTLAVVTATVVQALLGVLAIALYMIGMAALATQIPSSDFSGPVDSVPAFLLFGTCIAVVLIQFARRNTVKSRLLIVGLGAAMIILLVATPYRTVVAREFPFLRSAQPPFQLSLLPADSSASLSPPDEEKEVNIQLPFNVKGLNQESIVIVDGIFIALNGPNGQQWNSGWKSPGIFLFPEAKSTRIDFTLSRKVFDRMQSFPVTLNLNLAFTVFADRNRRDFVVPRGEFAIPEVGLCSVEPAYVPNIRCRAPLRPPSFLLMTTEMAASTCPLQKGDTPPNPGEIVRGWTQNGASGPAELGISPVVTFNLYLQHSNASSNKRMGDGICPGTRIILSNPEPMFRNQVSMEMQELHLADYREQPLRFSFEPGTK